MKKKPKPPLVPLFPEEAWFVISPNGYVLFRSCGPSKQDAIDNYLRTAEITWTVALDAGYTCRKLKIVDA
jgi:hypothetical protein